MEKLLSRSCPCDDSVLDRRCYRQGVRTHAHNVVDCVLAQLGLRETDHNMLLNGY